MERAGVGIPSGARFLRTSFQSAQAVLDLSQPLDEIVEGTAEIPSGPFSAAARPRLARQLCAALCLRLTKSRFRLLALGPGAFAGLLGGAARFMPSALGLFGAGPLGFVDTPFQIFGVLIDFTLARLPLFPNLSLTLLRHAVEMLGLLLESAFPQMADGLLEMVHALLHVLGVFVKIAPGVLEFLVVATEVLPPPVLGGIVLAMFMLASLALGMLAVLPFGVLAVLPFGVLAAFLAFAALGVSLAAFLAFAALGVSLAAFFAFAALAFPFAAFLAFAALGVSLADLPVRHAVSLSLAAFFLFPFGAFFALPLLGPGGEGEQGGEGQNDQIGFHGWLCFGFYGGIGDRLLKVQTPKTVQYCPVGGFFFFSAPRSQSGEDPCHTNLEGENFDHRNEFAP